MSSRLLRKDVLVARVKSIESRIKKREADKQLLQREIDHLEKYRELTQGQLDAISSNPPNN